MRFFTILKESKKPEFSRLTLYFFSAAEKRLNDPKFLNISTEKGRVNLTAKTVKFFTLGQNVYHF